MDEFSGTALRFLGIATLLVSLVFTAVQVIKLLF